MAIGARGPRRSLQYGVFVRLSLDLEQRTEAYVKLAARVAAAEGAIGPPVTQSDLIRAGLRLYLETHEARLKRQARKLKVPT
jgi:hypothetical protein